MPDPNETENEPSTAPSAPGRGGDMIFSAGAPGVDTSDASGPLRIPPRGGDIVFKMKDGVVAMKIGYDGTITVHGEVITDKSAACLAFRAWLAEAMMVAFRADGNPGDGQDMLLYVPGGPT